MKQPEWGGVEGVVFSKLWKKDQMGAMWWDRETLDKGCNHKYCRKDYCYHEAMGTMMGMQRPLWVGKMAS